MNTNNRNSKLLMQSFLHRICAVETPSRDFKTNYIRTRISRSARYGWDLNFDILDVRAVLEQEKANNRIVELIDDYRTIQMMGENSIDYYSFYDDINTPNNSLMFSRIMDTLSQYDRVIWNVRRYIRWNNKDASIFYPIFNKMVLIHLILHDLMSCALQMNLENPTGRGNPSTIDRVEKTSIDDLNLLTELFEEVMAFINNPSNFDNLNYFNNRRNSDVSFKDVVKEVIADDEANKIISRPTKNKITNTIGADKIVNAINKEKNGVPVTFNNIEGALLAIKDEFAIIADILPLIKYGDLMGAVDLVIDGIRNYVKWGRHDKKGIMEILETYHAYLLHEKEREQNEALNEMTVIGNTLKQYLKIKGKII